MLFSNKLSPIIIASVIFLSACGSNSTNQNQMRTPAVPQKLTIEFATNPASIQPGNEAQLIAHVSKGSEPVKDASVEMEVWRDGDDKHDMMKATPDNKGAYTAMKTFEKAGSYHATIHTSTSEIHQMPTFNFQVGSP